MEPTDYELALARVDELAGHGRRSARWLARYYLVFGVASLLIAPAFGALHGALWTVLLSLLWAGLITAISIYAARQRTMVRGGVRIHGWVMAAWTTIWLATVLLASSYDLPWPWWLLGGVGMLAACLAGAWAVLRRTGPRS